MINGIEGIPGGGKSYEATRYHILAALEGGRKVITNLPLVLDAFAAINPEWRALIEIRTAPRPVRGTWDAERKNAFELFEDGHVEPLAKGTRIFGHVWDYYDEWRHPETGIGALFVIDECHVAMPRKLPGTPAEVVQFYKLHRHFNQDVLLLTQSFRDLAEEIAGLVHFLHRVRQADIVGKPGYIKKVHAGYRGGLVSTQERQYDPQYFGLYKSHTQGNAVSGASASDVKSSLVAWRRGSYALYVAIALVTLWAWWPSSKAKEAKLADGRTIKEVVVPKGAVIGPCVDGAYMRDGECVKVTRETTVPVKAAPIVPAAETQPDASPDNNVEPLKGKKVHLTGTMRMGKRTLYTFSVSDGGRRFVDLTSDELEAAGYRFHALGACMGRLQYQKSYYPVTCDAPQLAAGTEKAPVVVPVPGMQPKAPVGPIGKS
ncbi:Zonular occludens toxin (Zot) [Xylophilus ampelinus]|nr:Zonular occludens toxin (Zot) [Xylophilus ampelinus]